LKAGGLALRLTPYSPSAKLYRQQQLSTERGQQMTQDKENLLTPQL